MSAWSVRALVIAVLLLPAACDKKIPPPPPLTPPEPTAVAAPAPPGATDATPRRIAVSHTFSVVLPAENVQAFQQKNLVDCLAAGCTILSSRVNRLYDGEVQASISIRIAPDRYAAFAEKIVAAPASLMDHSEAADDQTTAYLDVEKRLASQTALRDRLTKMLQQSGSTIADVLAIEKQLADVQTTIEAETARMNYLRTITDTVKVDVTYTSQRPKIGAFDATPVRDALDGFSNRLMDSLGVLIVVVAAVVPWVPVVALLVWGIRRLFRRRQPKPPVAKPS